MINGIIGAVIGIFIWMLFMTWRLGVAEKRIEELKATLDDHGIYR